MLNTLPSPHAIDNRPAAASHVVKPLFVAAEIFEEDQGRLGLYRLIGRLLLRCDREALTQLLSPVETAGSESVGPLGMALDQLRSSTRRLGITAVQGEFHSLFISIGTPPIKPYESFYRSGFMMEKPLAALRDELRSLGLARQAGATELEDHLGALCETMALLVSSGATQLRQQAFFEDHIAPWYEQCLDDISALPQVDFYGHLAALIELFFDVEAQGFEIDHPHFSA